MSLAEGRTKAIGQGRLGGQPLWMPRTSVSHLLHFSCPQKTGPNFKLASASLPLPSSQLPFLGNSIGGAGWWELSRGWAGWDTPYTALHPGLAAMLRQVFLLGSPYAEMSPSERAG